MGYKFTDEDRQAIVDTATRLGISSAALTLVMGYESRGLNPDIIGGKHNDYQGLIQFGPSQRAQYGYKPGMTIADQVRGPVYRYLADPKRGLKPGMGLAEIYSVINAGSLTKDGKPRWDAKDGKLNIRQHVDRMLTQYMGKGSPADFTPPMNVGQTAQGKQMPLGMGRRQIKSGPAVSQLQQQLTDAGFNIGPHGVDGHFGKDTAAAVRQAEKQYGLTPDRGVAGPQVQAALAGGPTRDITSTFGINPPGGPAGPDVSSTDIGFGRAQAQMPWDVAQAPASPMGWPGAGQQPALSRGDPLRGDMTTRPIDPSFLVQDPMSGRGSPLYGGTPPSSGPLGSAFTQTATAAPDPYTQAKIDAMPAGPMGWPGAGQPPSGPPPETPVAGGGPWGTSPYFADPNGSKGMTTWVDPQFAPDFPAGPAASNTQPETSFFGPGGPIWNASQSVNNGLDSIGRTIGGWIGGGSEPAAAAPGASISGSGSTDYLRGSAGPNFGAADLPPAGGNPALSSPGDVPGVTFMPPSWSPQTDAAPAFFSSPPSLDVRIGGSPVDQAKQALQQTAAGGTPLSGIGGPGWPTGTPLSGIGGPGFSSGRAPWAGPSPAQTTSWINSYLGSSGVTPGSYVGATSPGYTAPNFNPISGGATYAYQPNGNGGGTYVDSHGNVHSY